MQELEKAWSLKAQELNNCPYYSKGDSLQVQMPGVFGNQLQICSMPIATFIPVAMEGTRAEGQIEAGTFGVVASTNPLFAAAVRKGLSGARFTPAMRGGKAVRQLVHQPFEFTANN